MSPKQRRPRGSSAKAGDLRAAKRIGMEQADKVLAFRASQQAGRAKVLRSRSGLRAARSAVSPPPRVLRALGPVGSTGVLLAEGDSWFDYPFHDVLRILEDDFGYDVESVAHKGDRIEDMAYSGGQLEEFARRLEKLLRSGRVPKAILLSGGGNDIAGSEFALLLNHAASSLPPLNEAIVSGVIDIRLRDAYATIIQGLSTITARYLAKPIPIILHGYDYPVPDGRGFLGGFAFLPGPWLQPGFRQKGYDDLAQNTRHVGALIDRLNRMLSQLVSEPGFGHVHYLNLRATLAAKPYKDYWANELHPTARGFKMVTGKFAKVIERL